jgi:hypothetical protein
MLGKQDHEDLSVNMIFLLNISKEKKNKVSDALSRRIHEIHATTISMGKLDLNNKI